MRVTALLTGRGNNTLQDKNVLDILGHPVLYYPANAAAKSPVIDEYFCSSDDEKILSAAEELGFQRIVRPAELALPNSQHEDCIKHAISVMEHKPDILVVLLANNVTVKSEWITNCVKVMEEDETLTAVVPVYKDNDHHPLRAKKKRADGLLDMYEETVNGMVSTNRQDLPGCYFLSHNFWVLNVRSMMENAEGQAPWRFMGTRIKPYEIEESIDIHREEDLYQAGRWIKNCYTD